MADDPPYLTVGTEVSAKYKGAFCEAKIRKVVRTVKCRVLFKSGLGSHLISDEHVKGPLRVGSTVEAKHPDRGTYHEATLSKIQDHSQYTVVFDDGDITTLRRTALCLKSGRHFNESETLDQLPLTHPEHFSNPVSVGKIGRRGVRRRNASRRSETPSSVVEEKESSASSSEEEEEPHSSSSKKVSGRGKETSKKPLEKESSSPADFDYGKVVCVELSDKKKGTRDSWFPALIVSPRAQETGSGKGKERIRVKEECLVRSFKDGRYYTVPKKEVTPFHHREQKEREKDWSSVLKQAVEKANLFLDKDELPPHWDRDALFGSSLDEVADGDGDEEADSSSNEEKDNFVAQLYKLMEERGTPINKAPTVCNKDLDLYKLYNVVQDNGGYSKVTNGGQWKNITARLGFGTMPSTSTINLVKQAYKKYLVPYEEINKKLGYNIHTTGPSKPRNSRSVYRQTMPSTPSPAAPSKKEKEKEDSSEDRDDKEKEKEKEKSEDSEGDKDKKDSEEPRRSRSRQDSSRSSRKDDDEKEKDKDKDSKKRGAKPLKESKQDKKEEEPPPSPAASQSSTGKKGGRGYRKKKDSKDLEEVPTLSLDKKDEIYPGCISKDVKVALGDKISVIYPEGDNRLTYEAKVIDVNEKNVTFLVHYQGWNNRYDEWISRGRIAENLSLRENYQSKSQGRGPGAGAPNTSASSSSTKEDSSSSSKEEKHKGKKRGRSTTPAPSKDRAPTPSGGKLSASASASKISARPDSPAESGSSKRRRYSTEKDQDKEEKKKQKGSVKKSEKDSDSEHDTSIVQNSAPESREKDKQSSLPLPTRSSSKKEKKHHHHQESEEKKEKHKDKGKKEDKSEAEAGKSQVLDLHAIRSEMKGLDKMKPAKTSTSPPSLIPGTGEQKLDIYEFEEELSSEAPKLKMFSPRSPEKKDKEGDIKGSEIKETKEKEKPSSAKSVTPTQSSKSAKIAGVVHTPVSSTALSLGPRSSVEPIITAQIAALTPRAASTCASPVRGTKAGVAATVAASTLRANAPGTLSNTSMGVRASPPRLPVPPVLSGIPPQPSVSGPPFTGAPTSVIVTQSSQQMPSTLHAPPVVRTQHPPQPHVVMPRIPAPFQSSPPSSVIQGPGVTKSALSPSQGSASTPATPAHSISVPAVVVGRKDSKAGLQGPANVPNFPRKQEVFPHLVHPEAAVPPSTPHIQDKKKTKPSRPSPSKSVEKGKKDKEKERKEKESSDKEKQDRRKKRSRESESSSETSSTTSTSSKPKSPGLGLGLGLAPPKVPKLESTPSPAQTSAPVPSKKPLISATLPIPGNEAFSKINETISTLMQIIPPEKVKPLSSSQSLLSTASVSQKEERPVQVQKSKETSKPKEVEPAGLDKSCDLPLESLDALESKVIAALQGSIEKGHSSRSHMSPSLAYGRKPKDAEDKDRPLTPSFLKSQEVLEPEDEEDSQPRKPPYPKSFAGKAEEDRCNSLLCEEEIPGSPAPGEFQSGLGLSKPSISSTELKSVKTEEMEDEEEDDDEEEEEAAVGRNRPTLLPKKKGSVGGSSPGKGGKPRAVERSSSLVVLHESTPPSTPDSNSFSTETGSPHVEGDLTPGHGQADEAENASNKSKDENENDSESESGDNSKSYYSGSPGPSRRNKNFEAPPSPLSRTPSKSRVSSFAQSPGSGKKRRMVRRNKSPTDDYAKQFGYRGIRSSSGRRIQTSVDVHEAIRGPPPPPVNLAKRPNSEKYNHLYADLDGVTDPEERISLVAKSMQDIREEWLKVKNRIQVRERKERRRKRRAREKAAAERQARNEAAKTLLAQAQQS